jgi:hypothetical protein
MHGNKITLIMVAQSLKQFGNPLLLHHRHRLLNESETVFFAVFLQFLHTVMKSEGPVSIEQQQSKQLAFVDAIKNVLGRSTKSTNVLHINELVSHPV